MNILRKLFRAIAEFFDTGQNPSEPKTPPPPANTIKREK
jgi:hypothetical protein